MIISIVDININTKIYKIVVKKKKLRSYKAFNDISFTIASYYAIFLTLIVSIVE